MNSLFLNPNEGIPRDHIAARAYQIYVEAGSPDGHDLDHWLQAEAQLSAERQNPVQQSVIIAAIRNVRQAA